MTHLVDSMNFARRQNVYLLVLALPEHTGPMCQSSGIPLEPLLFVTTTLSHLLLRHVGTAPSVLPRLIPSYMSMPSGDQQAMGYISRSNAPVA